MADRPSDREERVFQELLERLRFWGYSVPQGEREFDPALLLMLRSFAHHAVQTENRLAEAGDTIIDSLISNFFVTGLKRPIPAFTVLSCECNDKWGEVDPDMEFSCQLSGPPVREYSFYPLYPQIVYNLNCDIVLFRAGEHFRVLKAGSDEVSSWEAGIEAPEYRELKRSRLAERGGTLFAGIKIGIPFDELPALRLYLGPEWQVAKHLLWLKWRAMTESGWSESILPGENLAELEIFKYLDIRELEVEASYQSRLYSSDFLTSGKLLWHFKHYLGPSKCFAHIPAQKLRDAARSPYPQELANQVEFIDFSGLKSPRLWLRVDLPPDEKVEDPRRYGFFDTNAFPAINRRKSYRNKFTMGQQALEVNLFELTEDEKEHAPEMLFSIDRVWDSHDNEYVNYLDLDSFGNPRKYMMADEGGTVKIKFDFTTVSGEPPDYVVVEYSETEGAFGNGIGSDVEFKLANPNPQIATAKALIASQGGSDAKSAEQIKRLTGFFLRNHGVALTPGEIEYLARNFDSRIATVRAKQGISRTPGGLLPSVAVDVSLSADAEVSAEERSFLLERLREYLDSYTPLNLHLEARWAGKA
ncbi:MAG: hypothetical protein ABIJ61_08210 [bacterium]